MKTWTLREAQKQFINLVESCSEEPQILSTHGQPVAAIVDIELFHEFWSFFQTRKRPTIAELIKELRDIQQEKDVELELPKRQDSPNPLLEMSNGVFV
jgi:prevent-host-death family protein